MQEHHAPESDVFEMYERLFIVIAAMVLCIAAFQLFRWLQQRRAQNAASEQNGIQIHAGTLHIVYFWSERCPQCKSAQKPILERLLERTGEEIVELIALRVEDDDDLAKSWGVRTLPTTYVLDRQGNVSHINNGLVSESRLLQQLELIASKTTVRI